MNELNVMETQEPAIRFAVTPCDRPQEYWVSFYGPHAESHAIAFYYRVWRHSVVYYSDDNATIPVRYTELWEALDPTCPHGLSERLCADPINHYPRGYPYE